MLVLDTKSLGDMKQFIKQVYLALNNLCTFIKVMITNPRETGAIIPSSKHLAEVMASQVLRQGNILELGAGTGVVTRELLRLGIPPQQIIVIEHAHDFVKNLRSQFPEIRIIE